MRLLGHVVSLGPAIRVIGLKLKKMREKQIEKRLSKVFWDYDED